MILCIASAYQQKFYLNPVFGRLPVQIRDELKIMCVLFTEDVGGILSLKFNNDGNLDFCVSAEEGDLLYDEIGSRLKIRQLIREKQELLQQLQLYYNIVILQKFDE